MKKTFVMLSLLVHSTAIASPRWGSFSRRLQPRPLKVHTNTGLREDFLGKGQRAGKGVITLVQPARISSRNSAAAVAIPMGLIVGTSTQPKRRGTWKIQYNTMAYTMP